MPSISPPPPAARHSVAAVLFAALSALMLGLAAGAVWMLPTFFLGMRIPWLALPAGWLLASAITRWVYPRGKLAAALAALATLLAAGYVGVLIQAAMLAGMLGIGLLDALRQAGLGMLLALARINTGLVASGWALAGAALAAWCAGRPPRTRRPGDPQASDPAP